MVGLLKNYLYSMNTLIDYVISLGASCQTHFHIKRHGYNYPHGLPFNAAIIPSHKNLINLLSNRFTPLHDSYEAGISFIAAGYTFEHIQFSLFEGCGALNFIYRSINTLLSNELQNMSILFLRRIHASHDISPKTQKEEIHNALSNIGFKNCHIELCVDSSEHYDHHINDIFHINPQPTMELENYWQGNHESWDKFFQYLLTKYSIRETTTKLECKNDRENEMPE